MNRRTLAAARLFERSRTARLAFVVAVFPVVFVADRWGRNRIDNPTRLRDALASAWEGGWPTAAELTDQWAAQVCGAFEPAPDPRLMPYRCTRPADHPGLHRAVLDGQVLAEWPRHTPPTNLEGPR